MSSYDVIVVGSGLAGLTAGLFSARHGLSTLILEANIPGGHLISIEKIEDFPGFPDGVAGYELCPTVQRQAADQGAEFQRAEVQRLEVKDRFWSVVTDEEAHLAKAVIVATGSTLKELGVPGEEKLMGRGVSLINMGIMGGVALLQIATGGIMGAVARSGASKEAAYRLVFATLAIVVAAASLAYRDSADRRPSDERMS